MNSAILNKGEHIVTFPGCSRISSEALASVGCCIPGADPGFVGWMDETMVKPLCDAKSAEEGCRKFGNQIMVRCHYKIRIFK